MKKVFFLFTLLSFSVAMNAQIVNLSISPSSNCAGSPFLLFLTNSEGDTLSTVPGYTMVWNTGQTNVPSITVYPTVTTTYSVLVTFWSSGFPVWQETLSRTAVIASGSLVNFSVSPNAGCAGDSFKFELRDNNGNLLPSGNGWTYSLSTGQQNMSSVSMILHQTTVVTANVTSPEGCTQVLTRTAVVNPKPTISIQEVESIGQSVLLANTNNLDDVWFSWNTGDNGQFTVVDQVGTYMVTVTDNKGCSNSKSIYVDGFQICSPDTVETIVYIVNDTCIGGSGGPKPVANFTVSNSEGCGPLVVQFWDLSLNNPTSWQWSFPGGNPAVSTEKNPVVVYSHSGYFPASLVATNANGSSNTFSISNVVHVKGMAPQILSVSADPPQIWPGEVSELSVDVSGSGNYSYQWSHGGTLNNSNHQHPVAQPSVTTPYIVQVTDNNTECVSLGYVTLVVIGTVANRELDPSKITVSLSEGGVMINADFDQYVVSLVDIIGRELKNQLCNQKETLMSTNDLPAGYYAIRVSAENKMHVIPFTVIH